jgi:hypothetical protein
MSNSKKKYHYKILFRDTEEGNFSMDESRIDDIPQVSDEENAHTLLHLIQGNK